jgi:hypothetical protein
MENACYWRKNAGFWCCVNEKTADLLKNPPFSIKILLFVFL